MGLGGVSISTRALSFSRWHKRFECALCFDSDWDVGCFKRVGPNTSYRTWRARFVRAHVISRYIYCHTLLLDPFLWFFFSFGKSLSNECNKPMDIISAYYAKAYTFGVLVSVFCSRYTMRMAITIHGRFKAHYKAVRAAKPSSRLGCGWWPISNTWTPQGVECKWLYGLGIRGDNKSQWMWLRWHLELVL